MAQTRVRITVTGEVQGVGYRYLVARIARRMGLKGYLQNVPDGRVEVVCEGDDTVVHQLADEVQMLKPPVRITSADVQYQPATGEFTTFQVVTGDLAAEMVEGVLDGRGLLRSHVRQTGCYVG